MPRFVHAFISWRILELLPPLAVVNNVAMGIGVETSLWDPVLWLGSKVSPQKGSCVQGLVAGWTLEKWLDNEGLSFSYRLSYCWQNLVAVLGSDGNQVEPCWKERVIGLWPGGPYLVPDHFLTALCLSLCFLDTMRWAAFFTFYQSHITVLISPCHFQHLYFFSVLLVAILESIIIFWEIYK